MDILYIGPKAGTTFHRAKALERLGYSVFQIDLTEHSFLSIKLLFKVALKTGFTLFEGGILKILKKKLKASTLQFEILWVDSEYLVSKQMLKHLKLVYGARAVCYVNDDPFGNEKDNKWKLFKKAIAEYDLVVVFRDVNVNEAYSWGAKRVFRTYFSADEVAHCPTKIENEEEKKCSVKVLFVGTYFSERGPFMNKLLELGVPLTIYGDNWGKAVQFPLIKQVVKGVSLKGEDYSRIIGSADVCLGLLSKQNRDLYTQRSLEIPYAGGIFCAERTSEHSEMYVEGREAEFWDTAEECASKCFSLLKDYEKRINMRTEGRERVIKNGHLNEIILRKIIDRLYDK